jgi:hypothetical protein
VGHEWQVELASAFLIRGLQSYCFWQF